MMNNLLIWTIAAASYRYAALWVLACVAIILLSLLPAKIAYRRGHANVAAVAMLGFFGLLFSFGILWVVAMAWAYASPGHRSDHPGMYELSGVDRQTQVETRLVVNAENEANARVKGDLKGMVVTSVRYLPRASEIGA